MPFKQQSKKSKNGKVKRGRNGYGPVMLAQTPAIRIVLPWTWCGNLSEAAASAGVSYSLGVNNLYDPNFTGAGAQPIGYDQYSALYSRYRAVSVRYRISFAQRTTIPARVGLYLSPQSTLPADPNSWTVQNKTAKQAMLGVYTGGNNVANFTGVVNLAELFGITQQEYRADQDFTAGTGSGPARLGFMHIWASSCGGVVATVDYTVSLWFETEMMSPVALNMS